MQRGVCVGVGWGGGSLFPSCLGCAGPVRASVCVSGYKLGLAGQDRRSCTESSCCGVGYCDRCNFALVL